MRQAPKCIVCSRPIVVSKGTLCGACTEAYDKAVARDATTLGLIRWAAGRARRAQVEEQEKVRILLYCADMLEQCAEKQEEWSGPSQALFEAVRQWRQARVSR